MINIVSPNSMNFKMIQWQCRACNYLDIPKKKVICLLRGLCNLTYKSSKDVMLPISFGMLPVNWFHMKSLRQNKQRIQRNSRVKRDSFFPSSNKYSLQLFIRLLPYNIFMRDRRPSCGDSVPEKFMFNSRLQHMRQNMRKSWIKNYAA